MKAIVTITSGTPTSANSKYPKARPPFSAANSETMMLTGVPVSSSSDPADAANASGMSSCEVLIPARAATTTTSGSSAATAPLMLMSAVVAATSTQMTTSSGIRLVPARAMTFCPAHAVTPVASSDSLTTKSDAMKMTVGIAEARERLGQGEHAGEEERERDADRDDAERQPVAHERDDREGQDDERCDDGIHALSVVSPRSAHAPRCALHTGTDEGVAEPAHDPEETDDAPHAHAHRALARPGATGAAPASIDRGAHPQRRDSRMAALALVLATIAAIVWVNVSSASYHGFWETHLVFGSRTSSWSSRSTPSSTRR